jgi:hypothetical protein
MPSPIQAGTSQFWFAVLSPVLGILAGFLALFFSYD